MSRVEALRRKVAELSPSLLCTQRESLDNDFMPSKKSADKAYVTYHSDGSVWAKGQHRAGKATGYWEWFRKDGTTLRSGYFDCDEQVGEWTTYDRKGAPYKVTVMKPKTEKKRR